VVERRLVTFSERLFLVLVASLPVMRPVLMEIGRYTIPPADVIFVVAAIAAAADIAMGRIPPPRSRTLSWVALYAAAVSASALMSADRSRSLIKLAGNYYLFGLTTLVLCHVRTIPALRRALLAWIAGVVITVVAALAGLALFAAGMADPMHNQLLSIHGSLPEGGFPRVMALFLNPNMYCAYFAASLAIVITVWRVEWMSRQVGMILGASVVFAALWSLSPGFGGLLIGMAFGTWAAWKDRHPRLAQTAIAASAIGAVGFVVLIAASPGPGARLSLQALRPSSRLLTWIGSLAAFRAHPWFGKGLGLEAVEIGYVNPAGIYELLTDAHNTWLSILVQCGVIGLAAFVALVAALLRGTDLRASATTYDRLQSGLTCAFVAGFLYQSLSGSFENTRHVWVLIGLLAATKDLRERHSSIARENPGPPAPT